MGALPRNKLLELSGLLEGTCNTVESGLERIGMPDEDATEVEDQLLDVNMERCQICDWWMESAELVNADGDVVGCDQCREPEKEED
jgi:hypothetical protein